MIFWIIAIAVTAIACAALFYAAGPRLVNATSPEIADANSHFRLVLAGIDADQAAGKLGEADALAAKGELAREVMRLESDSSRAIRPTMEVGRPTILAGLAGVAVIALGIYAVLGNPALPSQPLAGRAAETVAQPLDLGTAIARIEGALANNPDDARGWRVIAPAYMEMGRYADAVTAYRRLIDLGGPTPDLQTSLAEALMFEAQGASSPEAIELLRAAADSDPQHVLSRLYIAAELTRQGDYPAAIVAWNAALALSKGDEPWLAAAQEGLAVAQNDGAAPANEQEAEMIGQMVSGLATRLAEEGGSTEEWTRLVRAYLVLGDTAKAQAAFDDAVAAFPQAFDRGDLDTLALGAGLTINGVSAMTTPIGVRKAGWTRKQKRLAVIGGLAVVLALATTLVLVALRDQIVFFHSPSDVITRSVAAGQPIRLGGLVKDASWVRDGQDNTFIVTDGANEVTAHYVGLLPDLFREGQGVVAEGSLGPDGQFLATNVLAKHDENYVPKEVVEALKASGEWRPETAAQ